MARITIEELYRGEQYGTMGAVTAKTLLLGIGRAKRRWEDVD